MKVAGWVRVPGDKSITHRALLLAAMARGTSYLGSPLTSLDARSTARVLRQLGVPISPLTPDRTVRVQGSARFKTPEGPLNCGNSGTTARLTMGLLAAHRFSARITGDASLRKRPMKRVINPLSEMGARFEVPAYDGLPVEIRGGRLRPLTYEMPVSSAQIKSSLLLAGYAGSVPVRLKEPTGRSRDHTERMFRGFGLALGERDQWIEFTPGGRIPPFEMQIPGDVSSAAFLIGAALLAEGGELGIHAVGLNPTRTGFLAVLKRMGAELSAEETLESSGEPVGDIQVRPSALQSTTVRGEEIPGIIDEVPLLAALATRASGVTVFRDVGELRVKESDRLGLVARNIRALGGKAEVQGNDLLVEGTAEPPAGRVVTEGDHRLVMAFTVLGTLPQSKVKVDDISSAEVSFPGFLSAMKSIVARRRRG